MTADRPMTHASRTGRDRGRRRAAAAGGRLACDELRASREPSVVGKRSALARLNARLGGLPPEERKSVGAGHQRGPEPRLPRRRSPTGGPSWRPASGPGVEAERLDLTEALSGARRPAASPTGVTSTW